MITGGSVRNVTGKKRHGLLDDVLSMSDQPVRQERQYSGTIISFSDEEYFSEPIEPHEEALIITGQVGSLDMKRIITDNGSSVDILYAHTYRRVDLEGKKMEIRQEPPLYGFSNNPFRVAG